MTIVAALNSVRIRLRYPDLDTFVEKFAPNVTRGGVFLASRNVQPVGSTISFEVQLVNGEVALAGQGKVTWTKEYNAAEPNKPYGMGVQFTSVDPATRPVLARVLRARETGGIVPRRMTEPLHPLGDGAARGTPGLFYANGRSMAQVDTSADLAAEFGLDEAVIRRVIDRTWASSSAGRAVDDLADLFRAEPEPVETATLSQALAELPRLLDPSLNRRRRSGAYRPTDVGSGPTVARTDSGSIVVPADPAEITQQTDPSVADQAVASPSDSEDSSEEPSDDTDMTGAAGLPDDGTDTAVAVEAAAGAPTGHHHRRRRDRRHR